ncbi:MAG: hypothetical protein ACFFDM_12730, partial [Candidatus Thorarchaeota archaeon]
YYLAQHGGRVYLAFEDPSGDGPIVDVMVEKLLHRPIEPLNPGVLYPSLAISIVARETVDGRVFTREDLANRFLGFVGGTFRSTVDQEYNAGMKLFFTSLFKWLEKQGILEKVQKGYRLSKEARSAILANIDVIDYVQVCSRFSKLKDVADESSLVDLLLQCRMAQSVRPRSFIPSKIELDLMKLDSPEEWYLQRVPERQAMKKAVLERWLDEQDVGTIVKEAAKMARGISLDEGDLNSLLGICSRTAENLGQFLLATKRKGLAHRMSVLSRQLLYGVSKDIAGSDLLELQLLPGDDSPSSRLSRITARVLYENGYTSISGIVKKDLGASKKGYARDRFAKNCGLEPDLAKEVYKAALIHVRAKLEEDDDD